MPSKTLLRPGEAVHGAREAAASRRASTWTRALAWRDFMVSDYDDSGKVGWYEGKGIDVLRGTGRIEGPGRVSVDGAEHTARDIVISTGSSPFIPPIDGLRELDGVWTNREATGLTEVPRRMLVLGGGPVGVEMAQVVARMGGEVALVEGADRVLPREPEPLGRALGRRWPPTASSSASASTRRPCAARAASSCSSSPSATSCAATGCWWRPGDGRASRTSGSRTSASSPARAASRSTRA